MTPTITIHNDRLQGFEEEPPTIDVFNESPAGSLIGFWDAVLQAGIVEIPEGYDLILLDDDGLDTSGLVVCVEHAPYPRVCLPWAEVDNYLERDDDVRDDDEVKTRSQEWWVGYTAGVIEQIVSGAQPLVAFLHAVEQAGVAMPEPA